LIHQIPSIAQRIKNTATVLAESQRIFIEELTEIKAGFEDLVKMVQNIVVFTHPVAGTSVFNLLAFIENGIIKVEDIPEYLGKLKKIGDARAMEYLLAGEYAMFLELNPESVSEEMYDIFMKRMENNEVPPEVLDEYGEMIRRLTEIRELMDKYGPQVEAFYQGVISDIKEMTAKEYGLYIIGNTGERRIDHDLIFLTSMIVYTIPLAEGEALLEVLKANNGVLPEEYRGKYGHYVEMIELCYKSSGQNLTMAELDEGFNRQFKAERGGFFTYLCTTTAVSVNTKANNPAPSDASLDPVNNRFDAMEVDSRNGFKEYSYEPLPQGSWTNQGAEFRDAGYQYNMVENPGPLAATNPNAAATFRSGQYNEEVLTEPKTVYRAGKAGTPLGEYYTDEPPKSVAEVRIDSAVKEQWIDPKTGGLLGTSKIDTVYEIELPARTTIYTGPSGYQSDIYIGGKEQIFVSKPWELEDVEVIDSWFLE